MTQYNVTLTWNGVAGESPADAALQLGVLLGVTLPEGTVLEVMDDETGEVTEVEL